MYYVIPGKPWARKKRRIIAFVNATDIGIRIVSKGRIDFLSFSEIDLGNRSPDHRTCLIDRTVIGFYTLTNEHTYICMHNIICSSYNCMYTYSLYSIVSGTIMAEGHDRWKRVDLRFRTRIDKMETVHLNTSSSYVHIHTNTHTQYTVNGLDTTHLKQNIVYFTQLSKTYLQRPVYSV